MIWKRIPAQRFQFPYNIPDSPETSMISGIDRNAQIAFERMKGASISI